MKIITGTSGRINELLKGIPNEEFVSSSPFGDGKVMIVVKGEGGVIGKVQTVEKIVEVDNPKLLTQILELESFERDLKKELVEKEENIQTLQDALSDALNAEQAAKKEAEDLKKQIPTLKAKLTKLKNKFLEED